MQLCIGTSLAIIVPTTIRSYLAHRARGAVLPEVLRIWMVPMVAGVGGRAPASRCSRRRRCSSSRSCVLAAIIAARLLLGGDSWRLGDELPGPRRHGGLRLRHRARGSLMGVSGGSMSTMVLTLYGKPIHAAVGTSAGARRAAHHRRHASATCSPACRTRR